MVLVVCWSGLTDFGQDRNEEVLCGPMAFAVLEQAALGSRMSDAWVGLLLEAYEGGKRCQAAAVLGFISRLSRDYLSRCVPLRVGLAGNTSVTAVAILCCAQRYCPSQTATTRAVLVYWDVCPVLIKQTLCWKSLSSSWC